MDAATQSVEFALASDVVAYVVPSIGNDLGIEVGAVLEALFRDAPRDCSGADHRERVVFVHEEHVRSAMIAAIGDRWEVRVASYADRDDLLK